MLLVTIIHILAGTAAFLAGVGALIARKGSLWHRRFGHLFTVTMLVTAIVGALLGFILLQAITALAGVLASYLVLTGWLSLRNEGARGRVMQTLATCMVVLVAIGNLAIGIVALNDVTGTYQGFGSGDYFYLGAIAVLAAGGDLYWLAAGGYAGKRRIARHVWRMSAAMFFATGSLFTGPGQTIFPAWLQDSGLLAAPEFMVFSVMVYWLLRLRIKPVHEIVSIG